jgi:PAS domain S-box-containing protein
MDEADTDWVRGRLPEWIHRSRYPIAVQDERGIVVYANETALDAVGLPRDVVLGRQVSSFVPPAVHPVHLRELERRRRGEASPYVLSFRLPDGRVVQRLMIPEVLRDQEGRMRGSMATMLDLPSLAESLSKQVADELEPHLDQARALLADIGRIATEGIVPRLARLRRENTALASLTPREWEVAEMIYAGRRVRNIAIELGISEHTVRGHLKSIYRKLDVISQSDLIDWLDSVR